MVFGTGLLQVVILKRGGISSKATGTRPFIIGRRIEQAIISRHKISKVHSFLRSLIISRGCDLPTYDDVLADPSAN